jgi:tRNA(Ile)-lysidine synthase TilS/MesJ
MALAFLAKKDLSSRDNIIAFIVDHKLRPGSTDEALQVQRNLQQLSTCLLY